MNDEPATIETLETLETLAWNMGGRYSAYGQRVAAAKVPGGVYFVDLDRGLNYFAPVPLDKSAIRHAYLNNNTGHFRVSPDSPVPFYALRGHLETLAATVPALSR